MKLYSNKILYLLSLLIFSLTYSQNLSDNQQKILKKHLDNGAYKYHYLEQGWEENIANALKEDSTIATLWQMRALPLWKTKKYSIALKYYDKAVKYDRENYLGRRGYLKTVFMKDYEGTIKDFDDASREFGESIENDHSYHFYRALCYLQTNQYEKAEHYLNLDIQFIEKNFGKDWIPAITYFYAGVINYEKKEYANAINYFDKALSRQSKFADALYYKAFCLKKINKNDNAFRTSMKEVYDDFKSGFTFNENGNLYEKYPYQISEWQIFAFLK